MPSPTLVIENTSEVSLTQPPPKISPPQKVAPSIAAFSTLLASYHFGPSPLYNTLSPCPILVPPHKSTSSTTLVTPSSTTLVTTNLLPIPDPDYSYSIISTNYAPIKSTTFKLVSISPPPTASPPPSYASIAATTTATDSSAVSWAT